MYKAFSAPLLIHAKAEQFSDYGWQVTLRYTMEKPPTGGDTQVGAAFTLAQALNAFYRNIESGFVELLLHQVSEFDPAPCRTGWAVEAIATIDADNNRKYFTHAATVTRLLR
jgi:hypothetical protein